MQYCYVFCDRSDWAGLDVVIAYTQSLRTAALGNKGSNECPNNSGRKLCGNYFSEGSQEGKKENIDHGPTNSVTIRPF